MPAETVAGAISNDATNTEDKMTRPDHLLVPETPLADPRVYGVR